MRVDRPIELAELLLNDPKWNKEKFASVFESKRPSSVRLKQPLPVILSYWTAEADDKGQVHFRADFYGQDQPVLAALDGPSAGLRLYRPTPADAAPAKDTMPEAEAKDWMAGPPPEEDAEKEGAAGNPEAKPAKPSASQPNTKSATPAAPKPAPKPRESLAGASAKAS